MNNNISWLVFMFIEMFRMSFILLWLKKKNTCARESLPLMCGQTIITAASVAF